MALEVKDNKFKLPININSAGTINKELQTAGTFVDKNIAIEVVTPDGVLESKANGTLTGAINVGVSDYLSDISTAYPITIDATATITDVKVGVKTPGYVDSSDVVTITGSTEEAKTVTKYIKEGSLTDTKVDLSADGTAGGVKLEQETSIAPESGFYFKTSATGTGKVGTAGWIPAETTDVTSVEKYYPITKVSFDNAATDGKNYAEVKGPALVSGNYLYINEGYIKDTKISLADLVPDEANITAGVDGNSHLVYKTVTVYDKDGALITGTMGDATLNDITISNLKADSALTGSNIAVKSDNSGFTLTGTATISGEASTGVATNGYATTDLTKSAAINGTSSVSTDLAKISIGAGENKDIKVTPVITKESSSAKATGEITTEQPAKGHYVAVSADAISDSATITPKVLTAGYGTTTVYDATGVTVTGGSNASGVYYVPITDATHTLSETNTSTTKAAAAVSSSVTGTELTSSILSAAPADAKYLTISATATPTSGKYTTNIACTTTEGYSTASTNNKNVDATIEVAVTNADNKYIRIYGGELVETSQSA